ncbi:MAG: putative glycoside hydrolase [Geobacteraceae bacterium]|nr:putative glycoside hydrolase [Geobacteraceae bacterium]
MKKLGKPEKYFPYDIQINKSAWKEFALDSAAKKLRAQTNVPDIVFYRHVAKSLNQQPERRGKPAKAGNITLYALLTRICRHLLNRYVTDMYPEILDRILDKESLEYLSGDLFASLNGFVEHFPGSRVIEKKAPAADYISTSDPGDRRKKMIIGEFLLHRISTENPALTEFRVLFDDSPLLAETPFGKVVATLDERLADAPPFEPFPHPIMELLRLPIRFSPSSLAGQLEYIRINWAALLPDELLSEILLGFAILQEEEREWWSGPGKPQVMEFRKKEVGAGKDHFDYPEYERFSADADWMSNVVMIAKMVYVWLDQLSKHYGRDISRLDQIPDEELDRLGRWGFNSVWLIGVWERSPASEKIKRLCGNPEAVSSAYSLYDYTIASDLGGQPALDNLKERAWRRGIRLASDMVPNHTGIYSKWTREHPDWFVQLDYPPYPAYTFTGPDLSYSPEVGLFIEDGYWDRRDAAVVFKHVDNHSGRARYIYHGNDGTSTPWNDTAQLNYLIPEVREAVIRTIIHVARQFPIIRFDAAMTLAKKHYQRLWYPQPGHGSGVPSRAEHGMSRERFDELFPHEFWREVVDRMAVEAPDTLLLAEAFWLMEGYFVRTLGMHRVYNSAFMNMLKMEENAKYRQTIKNILEFNPEVLKRFVNFMSNPDERTAIDQFGKEGKYIGAAVLLVTMPGLPMFGHGQIEGFTEKYGMEYRRAYWQEEIDRHLVTMHEHRIFPLMKKRRLFSGSENFALYDFFAGDRVDENVFAYSNRAGGEKALIFYNNKFASTAGWIRTSAASAVKSDGGETVLIRKTLGEALTFNHDGRYYYAFRDYASGLEYLRHGEELVEKGMYVELEAYEYHVFLDFREIRDDDFGTWGHLCGRLNGRPVESLEEEVKQIRFAGIIASFASLLCALSERLDILFKPDAVPHPGKLKSETLHTEITTFLSAVAEHTGRQENIERVADKIITELHGAARLMGMRSRRKSEARALQFLQAGFQDRECEFNRLFLAIFIILHRIAETVDSESGALSSALLIDEFGLAGTLRTTMQGFSETRPSFNSPWDAGTEVLLMRILIAQQSFFAGREETHGSAHFGKLLEEEKTRQFLLVHWSNGVEWFNKERFEDLSRWLFLANMIDTVVGAGEDEEICGMVVSRYETVLNLLSAVERAGYRTDSVPSLL